MRKIKTNLSPEEMRLALGRGKRFEVKTADDRKKLLGSAQLLGIDIQTRKLKGEEGFSVRFVLP